MRKRKAIRYTAVLAVLVGALTVLRLAACGRFGLIADEAYYWLWTRQLDWSYYSKGPGVAWVILLGTALGGHTVAGVRGMAVLFGSGIMLMLYVLGRRLYDPQTGFWSAILAAVTPLFVLGSMLMTIDPLSVFFWLAAAWTFWLALQGSSFSMWLVTGLLVGLGTLGKYVNAVQLFSFALFLALTPAHRRHLKRRTFWGMALVAALCLTPILVWNMRHDWITVTHLWERGALDGPFRFSFLPFSAFLAGQLAAYTPFVMIGMLVACVYPGLRRAAPMPTRYLLCLMLPLLAGYAVLAFNDEGEVNWTAPAMACGLILTTAAVRRAMPWNRWLRIGVPLALSAMTGFVAVSIGWFTGVLPGEPRLLGELFDRTRGWPDMAAAVHELRIETGAAVVICRDRGVASLMAFYLPDQPMTYVPSTETVQHQFSLWPDYRSQPPGIDALYISDAAFAPRVLWTQFESIRPWGTVWRSHGDRPIRGYDVFVCRGRRVPPVP